MDTRDDYDSKRYPRRKRHRRYRDNRSCGLVEATILAPLLIAGCILQTVKRCLSSSNCGIWCSSCNTCGCFCRCKRKRDHEHEHRHEHGHERHKDCSTADLSIETRIGEVREKVILVENNGPREATITLEADPWMDDSGQQVPGASIVFTPASVTLKHCETAQVRARITVSEPLVAGKNYFSRIHLRGCARRPISVELRVAAENRIDLYTECESCRPGCGEFVEYCDESCCEEGCGRCRPWDPCSWLGLGDPHCHWFGESACRSFLLPPILGMRGCH